jgi:Tol biopolymer transport system component
MNEVLEMKTTTAFSRLCLFVLLLFAAFCHRDTYREVIVYRGDGHNWMMNPNGTNVHKFTPDVGTTLRWSPDGRQVAFQLSSNEMIAIGVANSDGSELQTVTAAYEEIWVGPWLNKHRLLVGIGDPAVRSADPCRLGEPYGIVNYILDLRDGSMQPYSEYAEIAIPFPSGDRWVTHNLYTLPGLTLYTLGKEPQRIFGSFWIDSFNFDVSPSGQEIVVCGTHHASDGTEATGVYRQKVDGVAEPKQIHTLDFCGPVRWSPDGKLIALLKSDNTLIIFDADTNKVEYEYAVGPLVTSSFVWSPRGDKILVTRHYGEPGPGPKELASVNIQTGAITRLTDNDINESSPQWVIIK